MRKIYRRTIVTNGLSMGAALAMILSYSMMIGEVIGLSDLHHVVAIFLDVFIKIQKKGNCKFQIAKKRH